MEKQIQSTPGRIDVADALRGLAVMGIVILHSIEHFNFYSFPPTDSAWLSFSNTAIWNGLFFTFGGKAYAIFAFLFGFSFYIQDYNHTKRGGDFRLRFLWRLLLLFLIGQLNASFFTGEVLVMYALLGFVLPLCSRLPNKLLLLVAVLLFIQPMEWSKLIYAMAHPDYVPAALASSQYWGITGAVQGGGTFLETVKVNLWEGQLASLTWSWENGRIFQTPGLFLLGLWIGRKKLFEYSEKNIHFWMGLLAISLICFFPLSGLRGMVPDYVQNGILRTPLSLILKSYADLSFMLFLVSGVVLVYYLSPLQSLLRYILPYGKMSLTNYITQSLIGSFLFYNWGLKLDIGTTGSALIGICLFSLQLAFCTWWMKHHTHGPLEYLWKKATWIGSKRKIVINK